MLIPQSIDLMQIEKTHLIVYVAFSYRQFYVEIRPALVVITGGRINRFYIVD